MKEFYRINLPILLIISFFLHFIMLTFWLVPDSGGMVNFIERRKHLQIEADSAMRGGRDIIVNINQDDKRVIDRNTLLSDRDSSAKGYITKEKGNRWLNNSLDFRFGQNGGRQGAGVRGGSGKKVSGRDDDLEAMVSLIGGYRSKAAELGSEMERLAIPDKNDVTRKNALFYSNTGSFSFNTAKFKNFAYFKAMKDRIASNWYPPMLANAMIGGNAPGRMRIMAIQSQQVKMYFVMDRTGEVLKVEILDSMGNTPLDSACLDSIRMSKNFGKVPDDIEGKYVIIPFIFEFISQ